MGLLQSMHHWMFAGACLLAGVPLLFCLGAWAGTSPGLRRLFRALGDRFRSLSPSVRAALSALLAVATLHGVPKVPPGSNAPSSGPPPAGMVSGGLPARPARGPSSGPRLTAGQYRAGFALARVATNPSPALASVPSNAVVHAPWTRYGVAEDTFWLPATNWSFTLGTNRVGGLHVSSSGTLSFGWPKGSPRARRMPDGSGLDFLAPLQTSLGIVPPAGRFWHAPTASNSLLLAWQDVFAGRDAGLPVTFQAELFPSGDFVYRYDLSRLSATNALPATNWVVGAQHGGGGETFAFGGTGVLVHGLELHWRAFGMLDPDVADHDGDGLSTYDEVMVHGTDPRLPDTDLDGVLDGAEVAAGTSPLLRDTDGDGLVDGSDPDPLSPTPSDDLDGDGIPDAYETATFGGTNAVDSLAFDPGGTGFPLSTKIAAGMDPHHAAEPPAFHSGSLASWQLFAPFAADVSGGTNLVYERTFTIDRDGGWQQYFLSASSNAPAGWSLEGMTLEWADSEGGSGTATASPPDDSLWLPVSTNGPAELTLRLRATTAGLARCARPLYLLSWAPGISLSGGIQASTNGVECTVVDLGSGGTLSADFDRSTRPCRARPDDMERAATANPFATWGDGIGFAAASGPDGAAVGGTLSFRKPGCHALPQALPMPSSGDAGDAPAAVVLAIWPVLTWGDGLHGRGGCERIGYDPATGEYGETSEYPLDSGCLWRNWWRDATGGCTCTCEPRVDFGDTELDEWFQTLFQYPEPGRVEATVALGGTPVWNGGEWHDPATGESCVEKGVGLLSSDPCDDCSGCENGDCDGFEGPETGSLAFRIPLGTPRRGQVSGFLWFRTDAPLTVTPAVFSLLARPDAAILVESNNTGRTLGRVLCGDARGRDLRVEELAGGVRVTVSNAPCAVLEHVWEIVNEDGAPSRIRLRKTSRRDNVMSDHTYVCDGGTWTCTDNIAGTTETVARTGDLNDPENNTLAEERIVRDAAGTVLSHTIVESRRFGSGRTAVLREISRSEKGSGEDNWKTAHADYWTDTGNPRRNGRPRLVWGDDRPWSYRTWDERGRETLRLDQWDGSACPVEFHSGTPYTLAEIAAMGIACTATETGYAPHPGDAGHPDDRDRPRTVTTCHVRGGTAVVIARAWHTYSRGTAGGRPTVTRRTVRAHAADAAIGDPRNAVSSVTSYDTDAPGVPLLLRGSPVAVTGEDGVTTTCRHDYGIFDPATRAFTISTNGPHLRTISMRTTAAAPNGIPGKSVRQLTIRDATRGTTLHTAAAAILPDGTQSEAFGWQTHAYDDKNRLRCTVYADGSSMTNAYSCCRLLWTQDRDGFKTLRSAETGTDHLYYAIEEVSLRELAEADPYYYAPARYFRVTQHFRDALGRETNTITRTSRFEGTATVPGFTSPAYPCFTETTLYPAGTSDYRVHTDRRGVRTVTTSTPYPDREVTETQTFAPTNPVNPVILSRTTSYRNGKSVAEREWAGGWTRETRLTEYDATGCRRDVTIAESSDHPAVTNSVTRHDFLGRVAAVRTPPGVTSNFYDGASARLIRTETAGQPPVFNIHNALGEQTGTIVSGITNRTDTSYATVDGEVWRVSESLAGAARSIAREQLTGLSDACRARTVAIAANGAVTTTQTAFNPADKTETTTTRTDGATPVVRRTKFGVTVETHDLAARTVSYYDAFLTPYHVRNYHPVTGARRVRRFLGLDEATWDPCTTETRYDTLHVTTGAHFDAFGRETVRIDALGNAVTNAYDALGRPVAATGAAYPVAYGYDAAGRTTALATARGNAAGFASLAIQLAGGASLASLASPASLDLTAWNYDHATGLLTNKVYADGSAVSYTHNPDGRLAARTWARGLATTYAYNPDGLLTATTYSDNTPDIVLTYDLFQRPASASNAVARYAYQNSHLGTATNETAMVGGDTATLARTLDHRHRLAELRSGNAAPVHYGYDSESRLSTVSNDAFSASYAYTDDAWDAGYTITQTNGIVLSRTVIRDPYRRHLVTVITNSASGVPYNPLAYTYDLLNRVTSRNADTFDYNARSEVTAAIIQPAHTNRYAFDNIGNALWTSLNAVTNIYTANELNQYFLISNHVNHVNPVQISPAYDLDGNMTWDGRFNYTYDAENRLVAAYSNGLCVVFNAYDHLSRRVLKISRGGAETRGFVYDGWLPVLEIVATASGVTTNHYVWGKDLSGTLQGAGGIGGLLAVQMGSAWYFPFYDNNGNITAYADETGSIVAEYAYDAFGRTIAKSGTMADSFRHRFSTKYYDTETGLYYYGYRFYAPKLMRWINRDPIQEKGFVFSLYNEKISDAETLAIPFPDFETYYLYNVEELTKGGNCNPVMFILNSPLNGWDDRGLDITLETGNNGANDLNNKYHQAVCVDTWVNGNGRNACNEQNKWQCCHLGKRCFSFGKVPGLEGGQLPHFSSSWLGWSSTVVGAILQGEIYSLAAVPGATIDRRYVTTMTQDFNWERYMWRSRMYTRDAYSVARHNCRKYSQWEFRDAPYHW
ncbi:MAG: RHS repeat-associated core domain-containing protein [Kiritimatiellia bacterium]